MDQTLNLLAAYYEWPQIQKQGVMIWQRVVRHDRGTVIHRCF